MAETFWQRMLWSARRLVGIHESRDVEEPKMTNSADSVLNNNRVGPVIRAGDVAQAVVEAAEMDNPGRDVRIEDKVAYVRVSGEGELVLSRASLEECLGRPFRMQEIEVNLSSFAGNIEIDSDHVRFYFDKKL